VRQNYNAEKRKKELDRKKKKEDKELKKKLRREAIARGEIPEDDPDNPDGEASDEDDSEEEASDGDDTGTE